MRASSRRHFPPAAINSIIAQVCPSALSIQELQNHISGGRAKLGSATQNLRGAVLPTFCFLPAAGGGAARPPGAMCLPHANNMDNKLQGAGTGGGASLRPRAGGVSLEPFIHQVRGTRQVCLFVCFSQVVFVLTGPHVRVHAVTAGGGSHQHDALRRSHRVQAPDQQRAALLRVSAARDEGVHPRVQRSVSTRAFVRLATAAVCPRQRYYRNVTKTKIKTKTTIGKTFSFTEINKNGS